MASKGKVTVRDATETLKGVSIIPKSTGDVKGICLNGSTFYTSNKADPVCIGADENGLVNFEAGNNVQLEQIKNGVRISSTGGGGGGTLPLINVSDGRTLTINARHLVIPFFEDDNYTLYLPDLKVLPLGTTIEIKSTGAGRYKIAQKENQIIYHNNQKTTEGSNGYLQLRSGGTGNWIQLVCTDDIIDPQRWYSFGYTGTFDTE